MPVPLLAHLCCWCRVASLVLLLMRCGCLPFAGLTVEEIKAFEAKARAARFSYKPFTLHLTNGAHKV